MSETRPLHQSGEKALIAGIYRLVARTLEGDAGTLVTLYRGDYFPDYQGRATSWYLVRPFAERKATAPLHTAWQDNPNHLARY
jgi:hypothetical protein